MSFHPNNGNVFPSNHNQTTNPNHNNLTHSNQNNTSSNNGHENDDNPVRLTPHEQRLKALNRQLEIEMKIKVGAENMLQSFSQGLVKKDKKLCEDAQAMLKDAKLKIEYIRMNLNKLNNQVDPAYGHRNTGDTICKCLEWSFISTIKVLNRAVKSLLSEKRKYCFTIFLFPKN